MRRLLALVAAVVLLLLTTAAPAPAHAYLERSNPADGETLARSPGLLRLGFSEHVVLSATSITVVDSDGHHVPVTDLRLVTEEPDDTEEPAEIVAHLPGDLPRGTYRVSWRTLSSDDLHRTSGLIVFGVRTHATGTPFQETLPTALETISESALLAGLTAALGAPLAGRVLRRAGGGAASAPAREGLRRVAAGGALLAVGATLLVPASELLSGAGPAAVLSGSYGMRWSVRTCGLVLVVIASLLAGRRATRATTWLLLAGAGTTGVGHALLGHAATRAALDPVRVAATAAHLLAAACWAGAVCCLAVVLVLSRFSSALPVPGLRSTLRWFALPAGACVSVIAVSGIYLASASVVSLDALVGTFYGRVLLVKLLLAALVGGFAVLNHARLRGPRDLEVPRRTLAAEGVAAALVLLVTAVLVSGQPATEPQLVDASPAPTHGPVARQVQDLQVNLDLRPNHPGQAMFLVDVFDARRPPRGTVTGVALGLGSRPAQAATALGDGHWSVPVRNLHSGPVRLRVEVTRDGAPSVRAAYRWVVRPAVEPPAEKISRAPIGGLLRLGSALAGLAVAAAWLRVLVRRLRGRRRWDDLPEAETSRQPSTLRG